MTSRQLIGHRRIAHCCARRLNVRAARISKIRVVYVTIGRIVSQARITTKQFLLGRFHVRECRFELRA